MGEYVIVIEDENGKLLAEVQRTATTGHPLAGEEIALGGVLHVVHRVRHEDDPEARSSREYTIARVFVRVRRDGSRKARRHADADSGPVLPFAPRGPVGAPLDSAILPGPLVAVLVACGYRAQATYFKSRNRVAAGLYRNGHGWFVENETPEEMWRLSRLAKRYCGEVQALIGDSMCDPVTATSPPSIVVSPSLLCSPTPQASPPSARPTLRLV